MKTQKKFDCKNEELVVICDYVQTSFERDLADFTAFAPKFNQQYLADFKSKNEAMNQIIFPQEKTKELKTVTARLYGNMDKLVDLLNRLDGYIKLAKNAVPISATDFGITVLKQKIHSRDAEGTLKSLQLVNSNIEKYKSELIAQGLPTAAITELNKAFATIDNDNQKQYEIVSTRRILTSENINSLNILHEQIMEICEIGKMLYKKAQSAKLPDYTFTYLKKKVRIEKPKVANKNV